MKDILVACCQVDKLAERLMPANLEALRGIFHATAVEVLLYLTPLHCQDMLDSVVVSLNGTYAKFIARNPDFRVRRRHPVSPSTTPPSPLLLAPCGSSSRLRPSLFVAEHRYMGVGTRAAEIHGS